jgi:hypothetical protein
MTIEALEQKHLESLRGSEKAIRCQPEIYAEIKTMLNSVLLNPVDVSEYFGTARKLAGLLRTLDGIGGVTIFGYFHPNIDPTGKGDVRYFRAMCRDLADQVNRLDKWRAQNRNIRIVK